MIIYPDGPNINFVNSILEKDIIKRIPSDYSLNLLTLDQNKLENKDTRIKSNNDDIKLEFFLPTWSYATTLISFILQWIDHLTLKDNSLLIPRISNK